MENSYNIAFVSGKLGDVDGVSLEVEKWIETLEKLGHTVFTIAGSYRLPLASIPQERQFQYDLVRFGSDEQVYFESLVFPYLMRNPPFLTEEKRRDLMECLEEKGSIVANTLFEYIQNNTIDVIIAENTNAMPMTLLGGLGVYKLAVERRMATIFHHHDFWWERSRFSSNRIENFLSKIMPPADPGLEHVVISSYAAHILRSIKRVHPRVIPNCEDFDNPVGFDDYNSGFRGDLGFRDDDLLIVQPTRIVHRKRIEDSINLTRLLMERFPAIRKRIHFIISLYQGDEPDENYITRIRKTAEKYGIPLHLIADRIAAERGETADGKRLYTNRDVLVNADLVTYLPVWEGFGNALLEAVAARAPVAVTTYLVYKTDIRIAGFDLVEIRDNYDEEGMLIIPDSVLDSIYTLFTSKKTRDEVTGKNFQIGKAEFSFSRLRKNVGDLFLHYGPEIQASRNRIERSKVGYSV